LSSDATLQPGFKVRAGPESFRGRALSASLTVNDLEKSLAWYRDLVRFTVARKHERDGKVVAASLVAGYVRILLTQDDGAKGWDRQKGEGFSLMITTAQDVDELAKRIKDAGVTLATEPTTPPWGQRMFRLRDPDGFMLTIAAEAEADQH
jgi:lactoylglutathione lyase